MRGGPTQHSFRSIWITGASSGIGEALAEQCAQLGVHLVLSGRSRERLEGVAARCLQSGATCDVLAFDLSSPQARSEAIERVTARSPAIDLFVNNAGVSMRALAHETPAELDRSIIEVDLLAGIELTKALLPAMVAAGSGAVCTVSSVAGIAPVPMRSAYNAAKAAQILYFGTLANELRATGVSVTTVVAGFVRTGVSTAALTANGQPWGRMDSNQAKGVSAVEAAQRILPAIVAGKARCWVGMTARLRAMVLLSRCAPALLDRILQRAEVV